MARPLSKAGLISASFGDPKPQLNTLTSLGYSQKMNAAVPESTIAVPLALIWGERIRDDAARCHIFMLRGAAKGGMSGSSFLISLFWQVGCPNKRIPKEFVLFFV
jgi:hypothetical protein